ncbi:MAG: hypothetical protein OES47_15690 [Acidobacteriota bacterium]|nr:hypothetical protein [Acidobacteriota bacterium]
MKQLTLRGFDPELERRLRKLAGDLSISLNRAALLLMRRGAGLAPPVSPSAHGEQLEGPIAGALDKFIGGWSKEEEEELLSAIEVFEQIDSDLWE